MLEMLVGKVEPTTQHLILIPTGVREANNLALCHICRFTRKLLVAVRDRWDSHAPVINKVIPPNWQVQEM